jgi:purine-cytosine permease-like protein
MVPDWDERQDAIEAAKQQAVADAKVKAEEEAAREIEAAVAAAVAEAAFEAELRREEAIAAAKAEADALAAQQLAEELRIAEEQRLEQERIHAEELAEQQRLEAEATAERERLEAEAVAERERVEAEAEAQRLEEKQRLEEEQFAELQREELIRAELEAAEQAAAEALAAAELEAELRAAEIAATELAATELAVEEVSEPEPVRASDFATGSFDIIESAEQAATEEFDDENFDVLLTDGELGFAREPKSDAQSRAVSTIERRAKPFSQLFVWSSLTVGIAPILLAYLSLNFELSAIDRIAAIAVGFGISALLISVVAIGGKRSGLSTLFLSRAAFGVTANIVPAIAQVIAKIAIGSVLVVGLLGMFNGNVVGLPELGQVAIATSGFEIPWMAVLASVLLVLGSVLALLGGKVLYWAQLSISSFAALAVVLFTGFTAGSIQLNDQSFAFSGNWLALVSLVVAVVSTFGALWVNSVADFTRKIAMGEPGKRVVLFVSLAAGVFPFLIATFAILLTGSLSGALRTAALTNPLGAVLNMVPDWLASLMLISSVLTLLAWAANWLYSSSVSLAAISLKLRRYISQPIVLVLALASSLAVISLANSLVSVFTPVVAIGSVLVLAWAGIFVSDVARRRIAYHEVSLTRDYGFYRAANWINLSAFVVSVALGLGFVSSSVAGFEWLGYIATAVGASDWSATQIGALIALGFASLFPILFGRKRIAAQEAEVLKIEARRNDLDDVELSEGI